MYPLLKCGTQNTICWTNSYVSSHNTSEAAKKRNNPFTKCCGLSVCVFECVPKCMHLYRLMRTCVICCTFVCFQTLPYVCTCRFARFLKDEYLNNFLNDLPTSWTRSVKLVQPPCTWKTGKQVSRTSMYNISIARSHPTELARLQQCLRPNLFHLHSQTLLIFPLWELLIFVEAGWPGRLAFPCKHSGKGSVSCGVWGQDNWVGNCPAAVWHINASVTVIFLVMGGERAACWDIRNREGMGKSGDVFVPVLTEGPAADTVPLERCVILPALCALPRVLKDREHLFTF